MGRETREGGLLQGPGAIDWLIQSLLHGGPVRLLLFLGHGVAVWDMVGSLMVSGSRSPTIANHYNNHGVVANFRYIDV